jgi:hypothetical protein
MQDSTAEMWGCGTRIGAVGRGFRTVGGGGGGIGWLGLECGAAYGLCDRGRFLIGIVPVLGPHPLGSWP